MNINNKHYPNYSLVSYSQKSKKYRRFNWIFLLSVFFPVITVGILNIIVNPYDVFNTPNFIGINHSKPRKDNNDRLFKATDIIRIKPVTVFLGSSRAKRALDPNHPALENHHPAYNLSIDNPNIYELRRYLEHAITNQEKLGLVIIGLDFFTFNSFQENQVNFSENRLEKQHISAKDFINITFSLDALLASKETIIDSRKTPANNLGYGENGFMPELNVDPEKTQQRFNQLISYYVKHRYARYQLSAQFLDELKTIVDLSEKNQIKLILFISPSHATHWEAMKRKDKWLIFEEWKREVVKITPVFDFSGYNSITTEPIHNNMENYTENSHYTPKVGNLILNRILSYKEEEVPEDFGILINSKNLESHLEKIRQDREVWVKNNPDEVNLVIEIKQKYDRSLTDKNEMAN
ncbi:hypothetical protein [Okeania sp.]|uniref:hypothetical protein n=1 Tax=Okeania sp. TaxID=3100323 RepID=UPI002B4ACF48|nr:hypothetical protein [Okeania sp.]MEB3342007.1 hypothetical protein [Okeania sp.]